MRNLFFIFLFAGLLACKENDPDHSASNTINEALYNEWGASKEQIIGNLIPRSFSEEGVDVITVTLSDFNTTIGYQFKEGKLCATLIKSNSVKYDFHTSYNSTSYLGDLGAWSVHADISRNTLVYVNNQMDSDDNHSSIVGFAPILSDCYDNLSSIQVTTGRASAISYFSAVVSGSVMGFSESCETGIVYGKSSSSLETKGSRITSDKHDIFSITLSNLSNNTTYYYKAYLKDTDGYFYGELQSFKTLKATSGELNGHTWVDLGLPSGLKWATMNVGANYEADYREWYAWGMTRTTNSYGTSFYDYYDSMTIPTNISGTSYDVARQKWGSSWRIPTFLEFKELYDNCTFEWTTLSGNHGGLFTGPNGNTIFMPAAGGIGPMYSNGSLVKYADEKGVYWSASMAYRQNGNMANYFYFSSTGASLTTTILGSRTNNYTNAFNGMQIRPVTD